MMLRTSVLVLCGLETLVWLTLLIAGISAQWDDGDPIGRGIAAAQAIAATLVFLLFVVPAFRLARKGESLGLAAILVAVPLAPIVWVLEPVITTSNWYISWFVWKQAPWSR
jgi:hypothetical protein